MFGWRAGRTRRALEYMLPASEAIVPGSAPVIRSVREQERERMQKRIARTREAYARLRRLRSGPR